MKLFDTPFSEIILHLTLFFILLALCVYFNPLNI